MRTPQEDIDEALKIEREVPDHLRELYLECMNGVPMSERETNLSQRSGCILTQQVYVPCRYHKENDNE